MLPYSMDSFKNYPLYLVADHFGGYEAARILYLVWMLLMFVLAAFLCTRKCAYDRVREKRATALEMWGLALILSLCVISFSGMSTFLYFNF